MQLPGPHRREVSKGESARPTFTPNSGPVRPRARNALVCGSPTSVYEHGARRGRRTTSRRPSRARRPPARRGTLGSSRPRRRRRRARRSPPCRREGGRGRCCSSARRRRPGPEEQGVWSTSWSSQRRRAIRIRPNAPAPAVARRPTRAGRRQHRREQDLDGPLCHGGPRHVEPPVDGHAGRELVPVDDERPRHPVQPPLARPRPSRPGPPP